jgi:hypothetical protein
MNPSNKSGSPRYPESKEGGVVGIHGELAVENKRGLR